MKNNNFKPGDIFIPKNKKDFCGTFYFGIIKKVEPRYVDNTGSYLITFFGFGTDCWQCDRRTRCTCGDAFMQKVKSPRLK